MDSEKANRDKWIHVRLKPEEHLQVSQKFMNTTCKNLSIYVRDLLLNKKITTYTRSKSMDDFMEELILLRKELGAIANNFNQVARKINACQFANELNFLGKESIAMQQILVNKIEEIKTKINLFSDKWSQE